MALLSQRCYKDITKLLQKSHLCEKEAAEVEAIRKKGLIFVPEKQPTI